MSDNTIGLMGISSVVFNFFADSEHFYYLVVYVVSVLFSFPIESLFIPFLTGKLINILYELKGGSERKEQIFHIIVLFLVICVSWVVNATAYSVMDYNDSILIPEFSTFLRNYIVEKLYLKYENQFDDINIGSINTKLNLLPHNLSNFLNVFLNYVFPRIFIIFLIMIYFFYLDIRIGAILMCGSSLFYILLKNAIFDCVDIFVERSNEYEHISEIHKDKISNLFSIYSSNKMKDEIKENNEIGEDYKKIFTSSLQCTNKLKIISYVINILLFFCINATTIYLFLQKKISVGVVISIFMTVIYLLQYLMDISYWTPKLVEYYGYIQASEDFMDDLNSIVPDNRPPIRITEGVIQFIDVSFDYDGHDLFQHINLTLPANHKICIVGKSGSGKSTFIKLIMGYYPIKSGSLLIDSQNINDCNVNSIRQHISYVHQNIILFNKTIYENIVYGSPEHSVPSRERVIEVIHSMNLDKVFQNGIDVGVGVNGNKISGGQKQVVFILRELFSDKKIMILDEPTSALDGEHKQIILEFVKKITGKNVIVISHDNDFLHYVDTGYLLKDGHLLPIPIR